MAARGTVAVTGARGFLGQALVPALLAAGYGVCALVRERGFDASAHARETDPRAIAGEASGALRWRATGDLAQADVASLAAALDGTDAVVHLAAQAHRPHVDSQAANAALRAINADVPARLARAAAAAGARHFVFASSVKVHGETSPRGRGLREHDRLAPADAYGASKVAAEAALAAVAKDTGLRITALRLPLVYGPGARANFAALIRAVRDGVILPIGSVDNRRSLLATGNFTSAVLALLADEDPTAQGLFTPYLVADARAVATPELVRALAAALGVTPRIVPCPPMLLRAATVVPGLGERLSRLLDSLEVDATAFRTRFSWTPPVTVEAGLAAAVREAPPL